MQSSRLTPKNRRILFTESVIEQIPFFTSVSAEERALLAAQGRCQPVARDHYIFREGEEAHQGHFLIQGLVALTACGAKDQPIGVEVIAPCEAFGLLAVVNRISYPLSALALAPLVVLELPGNLLVELVDRHHELKSQLLSMAAARFKEARHVIQTLSGASARSRLAYALTLLAKRIGTSDSSAHCTLSISRKQLSQLAGTTVETCIRELKHMEHEGLLRFPRLRAVEIIDLRALHSLAA